MLGFLCIEVFDHPFPVVCFVRLLLFSVAMLGDKTRLCPALGDEDFHQTRCPWKGMATYFDIKTMENSVKDGAWSYLRPKSKAKRIKGHIAFWKEVVVKELQANQ